MTATSLDVALSDALRRTLEALGVAPSDAQDLQVRWEPPRLQAHGDLCTSVALQLAKRDRRPPLDVAGTIVERLRAQLAAAGLQRAVERIEVKPPGFINVFLSQQALYDTLALILTQRERYGQTDLGQGAKVQVEFVSANPTGPLSVAHGRQAAVGDSLANLMAFCGYDVTREYYLNDEGTQIDLLGQSLLARYLEALGEPSRFPEHGYKGDYLTVIAGQVVQREGRRWVTGGEERAAWFSDYACSAMLRVIQQELVDFGVSFDVWSSQKSLRGDHRQDEALELLKGRGYLYEQDGAWWLKSTAFGDDKDRVVIRSDGRPTYIAADIAYHREKYRRGFQRIINLWGPDHHGYAPRMLAAIQALGYPGKSLTVLIVQLCALRRGAEVVPMSTREGEFVTLRQVMEEVGRDAARFFFLMRTVDSHLEFDLELAKKAAPENPVYYVQYAHARIASLIAYQRSQDRGTQPVAWGTQPVTGSRAETWDPALLTQPEELQLLRRAREFPAAVAAAVQHLEPHGIARYLVHLATDFHRFYDTHRVVTDDRALTAARLALVDGVHVVLATGLGLLGVSAPTQM